VVNTEYAINLIIDNVNAGRHDDTNSCSFSLEVLSLRGMAPCQLSSPGSATEHNQLLNVSVGSIMSSSLRFDVKHSQQ